MEYGGTHRTKAWIDSAGNDLRYVWSDENNYDDLRTENREVLYVDANPSVTDGWGGRINDGFHHGDNVRAERHPTRDTVLIKLITPVEPGQELYMHYGADYWQTHFYDLPLCCSTCTA
jgi:hypothetical protein